MGRVLGGAFGFRSHRRAAQIDARTQCSFQLQLCARILAVLRRGCLLLDEVDWILHPLTSELNWPLGEREPLDFAKTPLGSGLRWKLPIELIGVVLRCAAPPTPADGSSTLGRQEGSQGPGSREQGSPREVADRPSATGREMSAALDALREALREGHEAQAVQRSPHLVLLSRPFYYSRLLPLLASWAASWLGVIGLTQADRQALFNYLEASQDHAAAAAAADPRAADRLRALQDAISTDQLKLLNLCRDWLHDLLPHALSRRSRVAYGLLNSRDLQEVKGGAPTARRLLAVPFLGKDCPSDSSQFAHPDVVRSGWG